MRSVITPVIGASLTFLLLLSGSPAQALDLQPPAAPVTSEETESPADPGDAETGADEPGAEDPAGEDPATEPSEESPATETPGDDAVIDEDPSEEPAEPGDSEDPAAGSETGSGDADDEAADEPVVEAPESLEVSGTVYVLPDEAGAITLDELDAGQSPQIYQGGVLVATEQAGLVQLDLANTSGEIASGSAFSGTVQLPEATVEAVRDRIADEGELSADELAETVNETVIESGTELQAAGTVAAATEEQPAAGAFASKSHAVDVVYFGGSAKKAATKSELTSLVNTASAFWKSQSNGQVSSLPVKSYKTMTPDSGRCSYVSLWNQAIWSFGYRDANKYLKSGRHLVAYVNQNCGGAIGMGTIGSTHSGGATWVDLGARGSQPVSDMAHTTAHEIGHNLGLGHSDSRQCSNPKVDSKTVSSTGKPVSGSGCSDGEYGDLWSVMGVAVNGYSKKPAALPISQKYMMGFTGSSSLKNVSSKGGAVQTFTINAASASSGVRGLRIASPGGTYFVEYRNGAGQDSGLPWSSGGWKYVNFSGMYTGNLSTGVRVLRSTSATASNGAKRSSVLSRWSNGAKYQVLQKGHSLTPYGDGSRVVVESASGGSAKIRVEYKGFTAGGKSVSTGVVEGGTLITGKTLKAKTSGSWKVTFGKAPAASKITEKYQWYRNNKAIPGATKSTYRTTFADRNQKITVRVKPSASGWITGSGSVSSAKKAAPTTFVDLLYGFEFYNEINWLKSKGYTTGIKTSKGLKYKSKDPVTREQMALFFYRMEKPKNYKAPKKSPFVDVKTSYKYYDEIAWMYEKGLTNGTKKQGKRYFLPTKNLTRGQMAAFIYRYKKADYQAPSKDPFVDLRRSDEFYTEIMWLYKKGYTKGTKKQGKLYYLSKDKVTRGQMAAFIYRIKH